MKKSLGQNFSPDCLNLIMLFIKHFKVVFSKRGVGGAKSEKSQIRSLLVLVLSIALI